MGNPMQDIYSICNRNFCSGSAVMTVCFAVWILQFINERLPFTARSSCRDRVVRACVESSPLQHILGARCRCTRVRACAEWRRQVNFTAL